MESLKNIIPWGLIIPFLIIIAVEYGLNYGLSFYSQRLEVKINNLESKIKEKEENLKGGLETNEAFKVFSQAVNIKEILENKKSLIFVINRFNQLMPKFLSLQKFNYDADNKEIGIIATVPSWIDYVRFYKYLSNLKEFEIKSFTSPKLNDKNVIEFSLVLDLKPSFYQQ